jgi:murein DD-endopeptidase MepM/ murein hydrolase activator NlpD
MLTNLRIRRAVLGLLAGLLAMTTLSTAPPASAAVTPPDTASRDALPSTLLPSRVVPGVKLRAKPPPWVPPVTGYHLTGRFGQSSGLWASTHTGLDFAAPEGTEIRSIGPGVVTEASSDGAFGNKIVVRLDDGTLLWYCHQSEMRAEVGQRLIPGDLVGYVGSTGNATGPHLHLEVHPAGGDPIDPEGWLPEHGLHA